MRRSYDYHNSSYSSMDEYLERLDGIQRMPSVIADCPHFPNVHEVFKNNKPVYVEEHDDRQKKMSKKNNQSPEVHKKVQFAENEKKMTEAGSDGRSNGGKTVDVEADGLIQQKHKGFELCKWDTFKVY